MCYPSHNLYTIQNALFAQNFAGLPEDQITALPPEVRAMVMAGATALMSGGAVGPQMMGVGVGVPPPGGMMNPHEMGMMGVMGSSDMQPMQAGMMPGTVSDNDVMNLPGMTQEGFQQNGPLGGATGQIIPMPQDFTIQVRLYSCNLMIPSVKGFYLFVSPTAGC